MESSRAAIHTDKRDEAANKYEKQTKKAFFRAQPKKYRANIRNRPITNCISGENSASENVGKTQAVRR